MFGRERFTALLRDLAKKPAEAIHRAIVAAVREFSRHGPQEDDITLVVIKAL